MSIHGAWRGLRGCRSPEVPHRGARGEQWPAYARPDLSDRAIPVRTRVIYGRVRSAHLDIPSSVRFPMHLTLRQAASYLDVPEPTIRRWIATRGLPAHRINERLH